MRCDDARHERPVSRFTLIETLARARSVGTAGVVRAVVSDAAVFPRRAFSVTGREFGKPAGQILPPDRKSAAAAVRRKRLQDGAVVGSQADEALMTGRLQLTLYRLNGGIGRHLILTER